MTEICGKAVVGCHANTHANELICTPTFCMYVWFHVESHVGTTLQREPRRSYND